MLILSPSGDIAAGFVLGGLFSDAFPAPSSSADEHVCVYPDGAVIRYHHQRQHLEVRGVKTALIQATEYCTIDCPEITTTGNLTVGGDLIVKGSGTVHQLLSYQGGMAGQGGGAGTVISGTIQHQGGALSSNGVALDAHVHAGVQTGGDQSGGLQ